MIIGWRHKGNVSAVWQGSVPTGPAGAVIANTIERAGHRCESCGYSSPALEGSSSNFFTVFPRNRDFDDLSEKNLICVCNWCQASQCCIEALKTDSYKLIAAPWLKQEDLFHLMRPLGAILNSPSHLFYADVAPRYQALDILEASLTAIFPHLPPDCGSRKESILKQLQMIQAVETDDQYRARGGYCGGLRLLPNPDRFKGELSLFIDQVSHISIREWERLPEWHKEQS